MSGLFSFLVSPDGEALSVSTGGEDFAYVPGSESDSGAFSFLVSSGGLSLSVSAGGVDFFVQPNATVVSRRQRKRHYIRVEDNLNIYWQADDIDLYVASLDKSEPAQKAPLKLKPKVAKPQPDEVVSFAAIEALAREYDEIQAYRQALKRKQYEQLAAMYERLQDEQDVEALLMYA